MGRTRNTLTPMIGLSLAALVAGSLITLAVLAQRVTLDVPVGVQQIQPRRANTSEAPPLVVAGGEGQGSGNGSQSRNGGGGEVIEDRVLPLRIARDPEGRTTPPYVPKQPRKEEPKEEKPRPIVLPALPPGLGKKVSGDQGGKHGRGVVPGAKPNPREKDEGNGGCGSPPCGNAYGYRRNHGQIATSTHPGNAHKDASSSIGHSSDHVPPGLAKKAAPAHVSAGPPGHANGHGGGGKKKK